MLARPLEVDRNIEKAIYARIESLLKTDPPDRASVREQELVSFKQKYPISKSRREEIEEATGEFRDVKRLSHKALPELLSVADLNICGMYGLMGTKIDWLNDEVRELGEACDKLTPSAREAVKELAFDFAPDCWRAPEILKLTPTKKALFAYKRLRAPRGKVDEDDMAPPPLKKVFKDAKCTTTLNTNDLPAVAESLQVSLHWLLLPLEKHGGWVSPEDSKGGRWGRMLRAAIDECIPSAADFDEFLSLMRDAGYEIRQGKKLAFRLKSEERSMFIQGYTQKSRVAQNNYSEERIRERIAVKEKRKVESTTVMAKHEVTEIIIDAYLFMPEKVRAAFKDYVVKLAEGGGERNGRILQIR